RRRGAPLPGEARRRIRAERVPPGCAKANHGTEGPSPGQDIRRVMMGIVRLALAAALAGSAPSLGAAQPAERPFTPLQLAVACAPPTSFEIPGDALRITGSQDTVSRTVFGEKDLLVLSGGAGSGVSLGQRYYLRHPVYFGTSRMHARPETIETTGWASIVAV